MSNSMADVANYAASLLVIGSNTTEQHPVFGSMIRRAVRTRGLKVVVADPRRIDLVEVSVLHLRHQPGTDIALINGLMNIILEKGWEDQEFIADRTEGFDAFKAVVLKYTPEVVSEITGVPIEMLYQAAEILACNKPMAVIWAMGITQHTTGVRNVMDLANLQMLLGNMGVAGGGVNPLRGQNNVQGACDMGGLPNVYPAYQAVTIDAVRERFEAAWGAPMSPKVGLTVTEMIPAALEDKIRALYILGEDPVMSDPDVNHLKHCLEMCDFVLLQDIFPTETAQYADVLLPGVSFAEKTGTFTNTERRIQLVRKAIDPIGQAREDWRIISELAQRVLAEGKRQIGEAPYAGWDYAHSSEILAEVNALTPSYAGATWERLERGETFQWPVPNSGHGGTPILHIGKFARGKGLFAPIEDAPPAEMPDAEYPMFLNTGRVLYHYHGGAMTRRAKGLMEIYGQTRIEINPEDAQKMGLDGKQRLRVISRRGQIEAEAWITDRVPPGMVFGNFHFPADQNVNLLTNRALDPTAKIPEYKVCAVRVEVV
jgi:formate dehydrogenase major subunit/formate dehydrogenase alpha subunit